MFSWVEKFLKKRKPLASSKKTPENFHSIDYADYQAQVRNEAVVMNSRPRNEAAALDTRLSRSTANSVVRSTSNATVDVFVTPTRKRSTSQDNDFYDNTPNFIITAAVLSSMDDSRSSSSYDSSRSSSDGGGGGGGGGD